MCSCSCVGVVCVLLVFVVRGRCLWFLVWRLVLLLLIVVLCCCFLCSLSLLIVVVRSCALPLC